MEKTLVVVVTHRGQSDETRASIRASGCSSIVEVKGNANLPKARSIAFDQALGAMEGTDIDTVLCLDDDMVFRPNDVRELVRYSRELGRPVSGFCLTKDGVLAARRMPAREPIIGEPESPDDGWLTGLAFMAIPRAALERKAQHLRRLSGVRVWCQTGEHPKFPGEWIGEDFWFCLHFGGVVLASIAAGHLKWVPIWPTPESMLAALESSGVSTPRS